MHLTGARPDMARMIPFSGTIDQQSREDEQKNRRVELVLQPNVEEMITFKDLTGN